MSGNEKSFFKMSVECKVGTTTKSERAKNLFNVKIINYKERESQICGDGECVN